MNIQKRLAYGSCISMSHKKYDCYKTKKELSYGQGFYIDKAGNACKIYYQEEFHGKPITIISFRHNFYDYEIRYNDCFSDRGLMLVCNRLIRKVLSGNN